MIVKEFKPNGQMATNLEYKAVNYRWKLPFFLSRRNMTKLCYIYKKNDISGSLRIFLYSRSLVFWIINPMVRYLCSRNSWNSEKLLCERGGNIIVIHSPTYTSLPRARCSHRGAFSEFELLACELLFGSGFDTLGRRRGNDGNKDSLHGRSQHYHYVTWVTLVTWIFWLSS